MEQSTLFFNQIPASIIEATDLNDFEKLLFGEIYTMANSYGSIFPTNSYLAERYGKSKKTISVTLKSLQEKEYIRLEYEYEGKEIKRRYILPYLQKCKEGIYADGMPPLQKCKEGIYKNVKGNISSNISINKSINNNMSGKPDKTIPYSEIIDYLNEKTNRNFKIVEAHKKFIRARWKEGYQLEDFKTVIDNMIVNWQGKEFNGVPAENYLQPKTLFSSKFDSYLNQKPVVKSHFEDHSNTDINDWGGWK
uniref:conserved phage C-terminal domain-containing protein n=1 Tax=Lactococcus garvieae TaxID=1363 RepID=UPI00359C152B